MKRVGGHTGSGDGDRRLRALVIQHEDTAPGGLVHQWLQQRGIEQDLFRIDTEQRDVAATVYDLLVTLGAESAAFDDTVPWLEREQRLLLEAAEHDVPVLGICFGGQLLARVLGGRAFRSGQPEIGWLPVHSSDRELVPEGPWLQWHYDTFTAPPGSRLIAESAVGPQAYTAGRSLGVQFHPEVTPEIVNAWVAADRRELEREGVDPERLLKQTSQLAQDSRAGAWRLFDGFLHRVAGRTSQ